MVEHSKNQAQRALSEALRLVEHGYRLTPVTIRRLESGKKKAYFHHRERDENGKVVGGWRHEDAWSSDPDQIRAWWTDHPDTSFAIGGAANGIEGVDLDVKPELGTNAVEWWSAQGLPLSPLVQWTPSGGMHLIWSVSQGATLPQDVSAIAPGVDTRNRGGVFFAAGGYVVGEPGHYEVAGELPKLVDLARTPPVVLDLFANVAAKERAQRPGDGRIVPHDEHWQKEKCAEALQLIRDHDREGGGYRKKLQGAGLIYGRIIEEGFTTRERAKGIVLAAHQSVWGDTVWPENLKDLEDALDDGPRLERWRVPELQPVGQLASPGPTEAERAAPVHDHVQGSSYEQPNPATSTNGAEWKVAPGEDGYDPDAEAEQEEAKRLEQEVRKERRRRSARRIVSAEERPAVRLLTGAQFLQAPTPRYLVPRMLFADSTAKLYGAPGSTKSFLALDLVMHLVTGLPWRGQRLGRHRVHYVMAEGQAVNTVRALGWLHHYREHLTDDQADIDRYLTVVPQGVLLTSEGVAGYLADLERDRPALVVLDTKNAMMDGNENDASDVAVMVRAMREIRDAAGGACVLLVDHTGIADESRGRGSNAVTAAMDTEIRVAMGNGIASARVTRNKAAQPGTVWTYKLQSVADVPGLDKDADVPAVCVEAQGDDVTELAGHGDVWATSGPRLPGDVEEWKGIGRGSIRELARFMRYSTASQQDGAGFSFVDALRALETHYRDERGRPMHKRDTVQRAWNALAGSDLGRLAPANASGKWPSLGHALWVAKPGDPS